MKSVVLTVIILILLYHVWVLETPFGLLIGFIIMSTTRNYIHLQLFITRLRVYTITILTSKYFILFCHSLHNTLDISTYSHFK
jgi:hypothetical protein